MKHVPKKTNQHLFKFQKANAFFLIYKTSIKVFANNVSLAF